jgi:hypothetical protein
VLLRLQALIQPGKERTPLQQLPNCPHLFAGGAPNHKGSCWCGSDDYCMCTPSLAIDALIEVKDKKGKHPN